jgi:hypothetical protein
MITPQIPYFDIDDLVLARNNQSTLQGNLLNFSWSLITALTNMVVNDPNTPPQSPIAAAFYPNPNTGNPDISLNYVVGDGEFPTAKIRFYFAPTQWSMALTFDIAFFDATHITVTASGIPSVTGKFEIYNLDPHKLNLFCYSIIGTAMPVWMDQASQGFYGTPPNDYNAPL